MTHPGPVTPIDATVGGGGSAGGGGGGGVVAVVVGRVATVVAGVDVGFGCAICVGAGGAPAAFGGQLYT